VLFVSEIIEETIVNVYYCTFFNTDGNPFTLSELHHISVPLIGQIYPFKGKDYKVDKIEKRSVHLIEV